MTPPSSLDMVPVAALTAGQLCTVLSSTGFWSAKLPASVSDGLFPYQLLLDTNPIVLPPLAQTQPAAAPMTFQGDDDIIVVDMVASSTNATIGSTGYPVQPGFRVYTQWGARTWAMQSNPGGILGENLFGTAQRPYTLDRPWWIKAAGPGSSFLQWTFTNTTTTTNTVEIALRGWRRTGRAGA
jgi:hypothetical protein